MTGLKFTKPLKEHLTMITRADKPYHNSDSGNFRKEFCIKGIAIFKMILRFLLKNLVNCSLDTSFDGGCKHNLVLDGFSKILILKDSLEKKRFLR
jgi:hypothetical protein